MDQAGEVTLDVEVGDDGLPIEDNEKELKEELNDLDDPEKGEEDKTEAPARVRRFATIMNLLNSLLGAGILSVPSSFINCGLVVSIFLLLLIAILSYYATIMIVKLQLDTNSSGLDELALKTGGKAAQIILSILSLIFLEAALLAYLILGGDMIISWFKIAEIDLSTLWLRAVMILVYSCVVPIALTIPRSIKFLSYFSTATVFFIGIFVIAMIVRAITDFPKKKIHESVVYAKIDMSVFSAISIYGLAFSLPIVTLPIIYPYNNNYKKRTLVSFVATALCYVLVVVPSVIGYLLFGDKTDGNVLNNFEPNDILMTIVRVGIFGVVSFSYPVVAQSVMGSWSQIFYKENNSAALPAGKRAIVQVVTHAIPLIIAMFLPEAKPILAVGGALGGCVVDFCYPAVMWWLHYKPPYLSWTFVGCAVLCVFGIVTAAISTYQAIVDVINAFKNIKT